MYKTVIVGSLSLVDFQTYLHFLGTRESRLIPQKDDYEGIEFSPFYFFWVYKKAVLSVVPLASIWKRKVEKPLLDKEYLIITSWKEQNAIV